MAEYRLGVRDERMCLYRGKRLLRSTPVSVWKRWSPEEKESWKINGSADSSRRRRALPTKINR